MKNLILSIYTSVLFLSVAAQETSISLEDAIKLTIERNPSIQAQVLETERVTALRRTTIDLPKTDVTLLYGQYNSIEKNDNNISIRQTIPFPTAFGRQKGLNDAMTASSVMKENLTKNELILQVKDVFNRLLYLKARKQILIQQDSLLAELLRIAEVQFKTGEISLVTRTSSETQRNEIINQLNRNEADIQIAVNQLQLLCQSSGITDVTGDLENFVELPEMDTASLMQNPSLVLSRQQVVIAEYQKKLEASRTWPDLHVGYFTQTLIGYQNVNGQEQYFGSNKRFQGFQAGLSIPIWFIPHTARVKAAAYATDVAQKNSETQALLIKQQYNQAILEFNKNFNSLNYYKTSALSTADLLERQSQLAFKNGEVDHTTLLLNVRQALSIREGYLLALQQYNQSIIIIQYLNGNN
ncbi:MAG TPA: TolC family protein [Cyclobacteriaceae bacterium]|nr:TolC family protein [Cyclobacteriaceae bacterium]